eukprot:TRINITY_DN590_c0_g1_i2.p1 TRINITY_DN590_c0_g1~~TRINITY_DN590_c0_g1_i2.p1  ORF type:complete len:387 (+),score=94.20 TRINITY_DN590_c0_g1_i2:61-1221(+)
MNLTLKHSLAGCTLLVWVMYFVAITQDGFMTGQGCHYGIYTVSKSEVQGSSCPSLYDRVKDIPSSCEPDAISGHLYSMAILAAFGMVPLTVALISSIVNVSRDSKKVLYLSYGLSCLFTTLTWILMVSLFKREVSCFGSTFSLDSYFDISWSFALVVVVSVLVGCLAAAASQTWIGGQANSRYMQVPMQSMQHPAPQLAPVQYAQQQQPQYVQQVYQQPGQQMYVTPAQSQQLVPQSVQQQVMQQIPQQVLQQQQVPQQQVLLQQQIPQQQVPQQQQQQAHLQQQVPQQQVLLQQQIPQQQVPQQQQQQAHLQQQVPQQQVPQQQQVLLQQQLPQQQVPQQQQVLLQQQVPQQQQVLQQDPAQPEVLEYQAPVLEEQCKQEDDTIQ